MAGGPVLIKTRGRVGVMRGGGGGVGGEGRQGKMSVGREGGQIFFFRGRNAHQANL